MPFQSVPNTASFRIEMTGPNGQQFYNTLYANSDIADWNEQLLQENGDNVAEYWIASIMGAFSNQVTFTGVTAKNLETEFGAETFTPANTAGGAASAVASAALCAGVKLLSVPGGAPRSGRLFLSLCREDIYDGDFLNAGVRTALQSAFDLMQSLWATGVAQVNVSRFENNVVRNPAVVRNIASIQVVSPLWVQRDRRAGQGS